MTTATVDITDTEGDSIDESYASKLNEAVSFDQEAYEKKSVDINYYYSSGSFNFILEKGFRAEVLENIALTQIPFLPDWHKGIVSVHGVIMPVIDILAFVKEQDVDVKESVTNKTYLLKLEHQDHSSIVFSLDTIPHVVDYENYTTADADNNSPEWIKGYLENETSNLALIDHQKLFNQLIKQQ